MMVLQFLRVRSTLLSLKAALQDVYVCTALV